MSIPTDLHCSLFIEKETFRRVAVVYMMICEIENSVEVSGYNHNVLGGFLSLRIGLGAVGDGTVKFRNFIYQPIN